MIVSNYHDLLAPERYVSEYEPLVWAKKNCPSYITNAAVQKSGRYYYRFYFGNERDLALFILRWA